MTADRVMIVGAGPVGATAALLLADFGVPVTVLERHLAPHPLPIAVHLDDEVARILGTRRLPELFCPLKPQLDIHSVAPTNPWVPVAITIWRAMRCVKRVVL